MSLRDIRNMRCKVYGSPTYVIWYDHEGKPMEWHPEDPMRFRDAVLWYMTQSNNNVIRRWAQKKWGY